MLFNKGFWSLTSNKKVFPSCMTVGSGTFFYQKNSKSLFIKYLLHVPKFTLTLSWRRPLSYKNQSIDLLLKLMDWFLYDNGLRHERVNYSVTHSQSKAQKNSFSKNCLFTFVFWTSSTCFIYVMIILFVGKLCFFVFSNEHEALLPGTHYVEVITSNAACSST